MFREPTTRRNIQYRVEIIEDDDETSQAGRLKTEKKKKKHVPLGTQVNEEGEEEGEADNIVEQQVCAIVRAWTATHTQGKVIVYGGTI
jgi:predicted RNase H-like nuclease